jgi:putative hydrolase of the HAD superfamily
VSVTAKIELVCFDLGGVLVRTRTSWPDLCRGASVDIRGDSAASAAAEAARRKLSEALQSGGLTTEQWIGEMEKLLEGSYATHEIAALLDAVIVDEYAGIDTLIDDLHRAGIATACLSNTNAAHWPILVHRDGNEPLPGAPRYPSVQRLRSHHASHLMGFAKPEPAAYRAFEKATGYAGPQILFFDDLEENIAAARAFGWRCEIIDPKAPTDVQLRRHLAAYGVL